MKTFFLICLTFITFCDIQAQFNINTNPYWQGELTLADGNLKKGYIQVPNISGENKISYKSSQAGNAESIKRKEISSIDFVSEVGNTYRFENVNIGSVISDKTSNKSYLLFVQASNSYATFYVMSNFQAKDDGKIYLVSTYAQGKDIPVYTHFLRKGDSPNANMYYMSSQVGGIKKHAEHHFSEDPELVKKIKKGDLTGKNLTEIIEIFLNTTKDM